MKSIPASTTMATGNALAPEEWDFNGCPDRERLFACTYEYFRSASSAVHQRLKEFTEEIRTSLSKRGPKRGGKRSEEKVQELPAATKTIAANWPAAYFIVASGLHRKLDTPWLTLPATDRIALLKHYVGPVSSRIIEVNIRFDKLATAQGAVQVLTASDIQQLIKSGAPSEALFVMVNPSQYSPTQMGRGIQQAIRDFLSKHPETTGLHRPSHSGQQTPGDLLKALAAFRLREKIGTAAAANTLGYTNDKSLRGAGDKAATALLLLAGTQGWISNEFQPPACFPLPIREP